MKSATMVAMAMCIALGSTSVQAKVRADPCDAARCAVQATISSTCSCNKGGHGVYFKCYVKAVSQLQKAGKIPGSCLHKILDCGSKSTCGRPGYVICNIPTAGCRSLPTAASCGFAGGTVASGASSCCTNCGAR